jgi:hypothetical protein
LWVEQDSFAAIRGCEGLRKNHESAVILVFAITVGGGHQPQFFSCSTPSSMYFFLLFIFE